MGSTLALLAILAAGYCAWLCTNSPGYRRFIVRSRHGIVRRRLNRPFGRKFLSLLSHPEKRGETLAQNCLLLEIIVLGLDGGLSIENCLRLGSRYGRGETARIISALLAELQVGESRSLALRRASDAAGDGEIQVVLRSLYKAQRAGAGVKTAARTALAQSRRDAEVAARQALLKAPIKMLFPLVGLILPSLMLVLLAPAALRVLASG